VNLGIGERKPHTLEEHLHIKDLEDTARIVLELMKKA
jgi:tripeptide aminopeptidase